MSAPQQPPAWPPQQPARTPSGPAAAGPAAAGPAAGGPAAGGRTWHRPAVLVLAVLLVAALGLGGYLWLTTVRWQADSAGWESEARGYADRVAALQAELEATDAELVASREQLATATARISDLANEKAQLGDENVTSQQYLDYQTQVSEAAGAVASAMDECIQAQSQLIGYLEDRDAYDPKDLDRFAADVAALCRQADRAHDQLERELVQGQAP
jgi:Skp family chaperone for outer membrane proteins